jgi:pimeloyl-ACP methyl ester carboxylesterase
VGANIQWSGTGEPILFLPGWNTTAATVQAWLPAEFLASHRCGILDWPGLGIAADAPLPSSLGTFLDELEQALPMRPVAVVGFCLGGVAAWAFTQRFPRSVRCSILVESLLHFPLILTPLLVPGLGRTILSMAQSTRWGRHLVRKAILKPRTEYNQVFLEGLFDFEVHVALEYLALFERYGKNLDASANSHVSERPCWQFSGEQTVKILKLCWGPRHRVKSTSVILPGAGHFPAVEAPEAFFDRLQHLIRTV